MESGWTRAIIAILSVFIILIAAGQVFFAGGDDYATETAYSYNFEEEVPFEGVFLRDETVITDSGSGVLNYVHDDGFKAGKSTVIARRCRSEADVGYRREIEALQKQIEVLENAEKLIGTDNSQLEAISVTINESHSDIISCLSEGDYQEAAEKENALLEALCKREITLKQADGYTEKKQELQNRISQLEAKLTGDETDILAGDTGYFVSNADGYEGELGYSDYEDLTAERISEIIANPKKTSNSSAVGKLIADYHWRAAAVIDKEQMTGIYEGSTVTLRIGSGPRQLSAKVIYTKDCGDGKSIYVFQCDSLAAEAVSSRTACFKLMVNSYGGLRVPRTALNYNENGERGVYIVRNQTLVFKKVEVIYWGEDYVICTRNTDDGYLKLYDKIVTEGKDLYDGKAVG